MCFNFFNCVCELPHELPNDLRLNQQTYLVFKDILKKSLRRFHRNNFSSSEQDVFKTSSRHLQDVFARHLLKGVCKTTSRRHFANTSWRLIEDVLEDKKCYSEMLFVLVKTSSTRLHQDEYLLGKGS